MVLYFVTVYSLLFRHGLVFTRNGIGVVVVSQAQSDNQTDGIGSRKPIPLLNPWLTRLSESQAVFWFLLQVPERQIRSNPKCTNTMLSATCRKTQFFGLEGPGPNYSKHGLW